MKVDNDPEVASKTHRCMGLRNWCDAIVHPLADKHSIRVANEWQEELMLRDLEVHNEPVCKLLTEGAHQEKLCCST
ncbi:hypothetical protein [Paraburkholderia sp. BL25I1N1]|uniref:hypothetical protein n=1 Tax=Paraburkholderia sp. BL25I1N1 TaxID=1938804 RepID=UPI000D078BFB|nr:hypothetical protein [Paraburkholderia sp. BL25I1N1]PRX92201.1 hypothetical protein B0G73_13529 [Paraburkholderia sp. BL25I1N1]